MSNPGKPVMRVLRKLHLWGGLAISLPLFLIVLSGTVLIFDQNLIRLRAPELFASTQLPGHDQIAEDLQTVDTLTSGVGWNLVRLPQNDRPYYDVWLMNDARAYLVPGAATFSDQFFWPQRPETFFLELHTHLVAGEIGEHVVGVVGIAAMLLVGAGVYIWWPSRRRFSVDRIRQINGDRRTLLRSHAAWGAVMALPFGFLILTGIGNVYPGQFKAGLGATLGAGEPTLAVIEPVIFPHGEVDWQRVIETADEAFPDDTLVLLFAPPPGENGPVYFRTRLDQEWHPNGRSEIYVDASAGRLITNRDLTQSGAGVQMANAIFPLHATRGGAWWLAPAAALSGILGILLMGLSLFAFSKRRAKQPEASVS